MRIFIAGATGVLGRRLVHLFQANGHSVLGLVRSSKGEQMIRSLGGESCWVDLFDADALARAAQNADVVIHAATSIPVKSRTTLRDWEMNDRIRRDGTRALTICASKIRARHYVQQSVVWVARPPDGSSFDEDSPLHPGPILLSALDAEKIASEASERFGFNVSVLRCGWFYGADAAHTRFFGESLSNRRLPVIGKGDAVWAFLHLDDAAGAFVAAAEENLRGIFHVVDDCPVTVSEFLTHFAKRLGALPPRRVPVWFARLLAGQGAANFFTASTRTSNARFRQQCSWTPRFPSFKEGLNQIVASWESEGFLTKGK